MKNTDSATAQNKIDEKFETRSFEIEITNLMPNDTINHGQQLSPLVFVTHKSDSTPLFKLGQAASFGLMRLAEEGNSGPLLETIVPFLGQQYGHAAQQIPILQGETRTTYITTTAQFPLLSWAAMLVRTNDGFVGQDSFDLWQLAEDGEHAEDLASYDAGTERNSEREETLINRNQTGRDPENGVITTPHPGVRGDADAPASWQFDPQKTVRVVVRRVELGEELKQTKNGGKIERAEKGVMSALFGK